MSICFICLCFATSTSAQQNISPADYKLLQKKEDSLKKLSRIVIDAETLKARMEADSMFTKVFVRALAINNSIEYPFDSVAISKIASTDKDFRIYTWNLELTDNLNRQRGAIQMKTKDGSLKLFPLIDKSDVIDSPIDTITDNKNWYGAVYYKIIKNLSLIHISEPTKLRRIS